MGSAPLPQLDRPFLTDAGLETDIVFNRGIDLPHFASIGLLGSQEGRDALDQYFRGFLHLAQRTGIGLILESATWRASPDWARPLGLSQAELDGLNRAAIDMLIGLRQEYRTTVPHIVVSGCIGPRGDGYDPGKLMTTDEAEAYHSHQTEVLALAGVDMLSAITMTNVSEAIGVAQAARKLATPVAISFTVETDGRLPTGDTLAAAVCAVDEATGAYPAYFMINCAHPTHFSTSLQEGADWTARIRGVRANASRCSHAELDAMTELDMGDPSELAALHRELRQRFPHINVLGGCCGTDLRHVTAIAEPVSELRELSGRLRSRDGSRMEGAMTVVSIFGAGGRMGRAIAEAAALRGDVRLSGQGPDVFVDFSVPEAVGDHLRQARQAGKPILIGTTGLDADHYRLIDEAAAEIPLIYAANTSLGVNLLAHLVRETAARLGEDWDLEIVEMHHRMKADAPSGTALMLGRAGAEGRGVELGSVAERGRDGITGPREPGRIGFASLRGGSVAGEHLAIFAAEGERLELGHRAEGRAIFARGAVEAALWLVGKPAGRYSMADVLGLK